MKCKDCSRPITKLNYDERLCDRCAIGYGMVHDNNDFNFVCPNCNKKQTNVREYRKVLMADVFDFEKHDFIKSEKTDEQEHEYFECTNCDGIIFEQELIDDIWKNLG